MSEDNEGLIITTVVALIVAAVVNFVAVYIHEKNYSVQEEPERVASCLPTSNRSFCVPK